MSCSLKVELHSSKVTIWVRLPTRQTIRYLFINLPVYKCVYRIDNCFLYLEIKQIKLGMIEKRILYNNICTFGFLFQQIQAAIYQRLHTVAFFLI